mgnify:CR=1 FL=1
MVRTALERFVLLWRDGGGQSAARNEASWRTSLEHLVSCTEGFDQERESRGRDFLIDLISAEIVERLASPSRSPVSLDRCTIPYAFLHQSESLLYPRVGAVHRALLRSPARRICAAPMRPTNLDSRLLAAQE